MKSAPKPPVIPPDLSRRVHTLQLIWFALLVGMVTVSVALWYVREQQDAEKREQGAIVEAHDGHGPGDEEVPLALVLAGIGGVLLLMSLVVPGQVGANMPATFESYQTVRIMQAGMLEGGGMLQAIAYLLEGQWWSLAVAGLFVLVLLGLLPTRDHATRWIQRHGMG